MILFHVSHGVAGEIQNNHEQQEKTNSESNSDDGIYTDNISIIDEKLTVDMVNNYRKTEIHSYIDTYAGYRLLSENGNGKAAAMYDYLNSGLFAGVSMGYLSPALKYVLDAAYLNNKDYYGDLLLDYAGYYRGHLRTESLYHNLTSQDLFDQTFRLFGADFHSSATLDNNFGVRVEQDMIAFRVKMHDFPLHINLGYWHLQKSGARQLLFGDTGLFERTVIPSSEYSTNMIYSRSRKIDRTTDEGSIGFDSHLGLLDLAYSFQIRQFTDNSYTIDPIVYANRYRPDNGFQEKVYQENNIAPDSRFLNHTLKLHSSMAGGVVGAASYSISRRDNRTQYTDFKGADYASTNLQNIAGDINYTPLKEFSLALKYRRQEIDNNAREISLLTSDRYMRPAIDSQKNIIIATLSVRPNNLITIKGEYKGEYLHRDLNALDRNVHNTDMNENEETHRWTLGLNSKPFKGLKLRTQYNYTVTNNSSYGTSFEEKHEGDVMAVYNYANKWGATSSYRRSKEINDKISINVLTFDSSFSTYPTTLYRERSLDNFTSSIWLIPIDKLTFSANYSYLRSSIDQAVLFTSISPVYSSATNFKSNSQVYGLNAVYQMTDKLDLSVSVQEVLSSSEFDPVFVTFSSNEDTSGITELSRLKIVDSILSARADYRIHKNINCSLEYSYREYDDKYSSANDGKVQLVKLILSSKW
jgi:hypothetical protein